MFVNTTMFANTGIHKRQIFVNIGIVKRLSENPASQGVLPRCHTCLRICKCVYMAGVILMVKVMVKSLGRPSVAGGDAGAERRLVLHRQPDHARPGACHTLLLVHVTTRGDLFV